MTDVIAPRRDRSVAWHGLSAEEACARLEVDVHVVHGVTNRIHNAVRAVKGLQLEVESVVFTGLAASLAVLSNEQKETGALVIDLRRMDQLRMLPGGVR